jgi:carbonic anhydrase
MDKILQGIAVFQRDVYPRYRELYAEIAHKHDPDALLITCADARIAPELIFQCKPGEIFMCRVAGNFIPPFGAKDGVAATIEFAVSTWKVGDMIVCGHSDCAAVKAVLDPGAAASMIAVSEWLKHGQRARTVVQARLGVRPTLEHLDAVIEENVLAQLDHLKTYPWVAARLKDGLLRLHAWVYEIGTGVIRAYDAESNRFRPLQPAGGTARLSSN